MNDTEICRECGKAHVGAHVGAIDNTADSGRQEISKTGTLARRKFFAGEPYREARAMKTLRSSSLGQGR